MRISSPVSLTSFPSKLPDPILSPQQNECALYRDEKDEEVYFAGIPCYTVLAGMSQGNVVG